MSWPPRRELSIADDEPTEKIPAYLTLVARSFELAPCDNQLEQAPGLGNNALDALDALHASELADAFASLDKLESAVPAPLESGVVPVGRSLGLEKREVIPPPAALPRIAAPFPPPAAIEQTVVQRNPRAATTRAAASRCVASGVIALFALFMLVVVAKRPDVVAPQIARTVAVLTAHAKSEQAIGSAASRSTATRAARATRSVPASRHVATSAHAGQIVRAMPF